MTLSPATLELLLVAASLIVIVVLLRALDGLIFAIAVAAVAGLAQVLMHQPVVAVGFALVSIALRVVQSKRGSLPYAFEHKSLAVEVGMVLGGLTAYTGMRYLIEAQFREAQANAVRVVDFERGLGLLQERHIQSAVMQNELVMRSFNAIYAFAFLGTVASVLLWLYFMDRPNYRLMRNCLGVSALLGLITISAFPVAPPRMIPEVGVIDTILAMGKEQKFANEFGAIPSLHVGWMVLSGAMLWRSIGGRRGLLIGAIPAGTMALTVIVTGNHYVVDGVIGSAFCLLPLLIMSNWTRISGVVIGQPEPAVVLSREVIEGG